MIRRRRECLLLLYIFSYGKSCHYHRQMFLIFVCPWEELSSGSSYSVILAAPQNTQDIIFGLDINCILLIVHFRP